MNVLVLGGAASGKSAFAEKMACERSKAQRAPLVYVATLNPDAGGDTAERIQKHRAARAGNGFITVEWQNAESVPALAACDGARPVALVEDGGNMVANYLYPPERFSAHGGADASCTAATEPTATAENISDAKTAADAMVANLSALSAHCTDCIVVSNEISLGGDIPAGSRLYAEVLAAVNARWAAMCDEVYAVVAGIPLRLR